MTKLIFRKFLIIIFLTLVLTVGFLFLKREKLSNESKNFFTRYEEIDVKPLFIGDKDDPKGEKTFSSPISEDHRGTVVPENKKREIFFTFKKPISFDSFSLFFKGNLHSVSSYLAEDFEIFCKDKNSWGEIAEVKGNKESVYQFYSPATIQTDSIKILVSKAPFFNTVAFGDLKFYKKHKVGFIEGVKNFLFQQRKSPLAYLFYSFLFYILLLIPGYAILDLTGKKWKGLRDIEYRIVFAPIISIVILFFIALFYLLIGNLKILNFYWIIFALSFFVFLKKRLDREIFSAKFVLFLIGIVLLITFLIQAQRDYLFNLQYIEKYLDKLEFIPLRGGYYGYHADNTLQWGIAKLFLDRMPIFGSQTKSYLMGFEPTSVFDRTPLLPTITAVILKMFNESHFIYQRFLNVLAALYFATFYLLLRIYFSKRVAKISSLLLFLNVPLTFMAFNVEFYYKYFALYPILLAYILYFLDKKNKEQFLIGILLGLGFLIHPMTLIFSFVLLFLYFLRYRFTPKFLKRTAVILSLLIILITLWFSISQFFKKETGISEKNLYLEKLTTVNTQAIKNKIINLVELFVPKALSIKKIEWRNQLTLSNFWIPNLRFSIIFNLTPVMFILFFIYLWKNFKKNYEILSMATLPLFILIILHPEHIPGIFLLVYPFTIPCFFGFITNNLIKEKKLIRLFVFASYSFFMFISLYFISGVFVEMKYASLVIYGLFWAIILTYAFLSLLLIKMGVIDDH